MPHEMVIPNLASPLEFGHSQLESARQGGIEFPIDVYKANVTLSYYDASAPSIGEAKTPGVWLETAGNSNAHFGLRIVSAVPQQDPADLKLALGELWKAIDGDANREALLNELLTSSPGRMMLPLDLVWEANAPISKALSPVSQYLSFLGAEVVTSGFAQAARETFSSVLLGLEGKRIGEDGADKKVILEAVSPLILASCDQHLIHGRDTVITAVVDSSHRILAEDLPGKLVDLVVEQFSGRRILDMQPPV
jgi:hypothetical protein